MVAGLLATGCAKLLELGGDSAKRLIDVESTDFVRDERTDFDDGTFVFQPE